MKLAAMEGLYTGQEGAELIAIGILNHDKEINDGQDPHKMKIAFPKMLSWLSYGNTNAFVPGIEDLINGNEKYSILSAEERIQKGDSARWALTEFKEAKKAGDEEAAAEYLALFRENESHFGYGFYRK